MNLVSFHISHVPHLCDINVQYCDKIAIVCGAYLHFLLKFYIRNSELFGHKNAIFSVSFNSLFDLENMVKVTHIGVKYGTHGKAAACTITIS